MYRTDESELGMFGGKCILFSEGCSLLTKKTKSRLKSAGIIQLGPVCTSDHALKAIETMAVDAVILDAALDPAAVFPLIARLQELAIPFIFALTPTQDGTSRAGFVLSDRDSDLLRIGNSLFPPPAKDRAKIHNAAIDRASHE